MKKWGKTHAIARQIVENPKRISDIPLFLVNNVAENSSLSYNYYVFLCRWGDEMSNKKAKKWIVGLLCVALVLSFGYASNVLATKDKTLDEMITDTFTIIEDDGTTRVIPLEVIAADEGEEVSVAEKYDIVNHIGGDLETIETFDNQAEAQEALTQMENQRQEVNYTVAPFDLSRSITTGVAYIKTSGVSEYTNVKTKMSGYTTGAYGVDAAYLGTYNGKIRLKFSGVVADFSPSDVNVVNYSSDADVSYYKVEDGILRHYYVYGSSHAYASTRVGYALDYLNENQAYYSYDGHYFYSDYPTMIKDYQNDVYTHAVNPDEPYYNYYQYLSHRAKSNLSGSDFDQISKDVMGSTSYLSSKFNNMGDYFVKYQNEYSVNAMLMFGVAANESNWGRSSIAQDKNNLFGHGANDSNPYWGASGYDSPASSIYDHAWHFVSRTYLDYPDWRYYGAHLGDKEGGMNVKYASDPYWGEKAASRSYHLSEQPEEYGAETIGIIDGVLTRYPLYKEPSTNSQVVFSASYLSNLPVVIIDTLEAEGKTWYKILSDTSLTNDRTQTDYSKVYDASRDYLYVLADTVSIVNGQEEEPQEPSVPTDPIILGDVNGDGKISPVDYVKVKNHIIGKSVLTGDSLKAADVNQDGKISPVDYVKIKNKIIND